MLLTPFHDAHKNFIIQSSPECNEKQKSGVRSQKKRKSVTAVLRLLFWLLDSDSWIPAFLLTPVF
jgi:hypothetical protein